MAKMGRPISDDPCLQRVTVRFTEKEYEFLKKYAESHNLTMTQTIKIGVKLLIENN